MRRLVISLAVLATLSILSGGALARDNTSANPYTLLDETGKQLREDFNRAKGTVRLLFVVDPSCAGCLRGLDDVNKALLAKTRDLRLQTFVVHVPVLRPAPKEKDVAPAAELLRNAQVRHYWNPSGAFGRQLSQGVGLKRSEESVYAWDVWLIYGPDARWDGVSPPKPQLLMHQLRALQGSEFPRLDAEAFAREVHQLLAQPSSATASQ